MSVDATGSLLVVGDRFGVERMPANVISVSDFLAGLRSGRFDGSDRPSRVRLGLAIGAEAELQLRQELERFGPEKAPVIDAPGPRPVPRSEVHKRHDRNVLISGLEALSPGRFRAQLRIHPDNDMLLDHTTGWHIPGMVVLESMRQIGLAAIERFYRQKMGAQHEQSFVIRRWTTFFDSLAFPLRSELRLSMEVGAASRKRTDYNAEVSLWQGEETPARANVDFSLIAKDTMEAIEQRHARKTVDAFLKASP